MKRILIVFALLVCFAAPAQIANAFSFDASKSLEKNLAALAKESGNKVMAINSGTFTPKGSDDYFTLVQLYLNPSFSGTTPLDSLSPVVNNGLSMAMDKTFDELLLSKPNQTTFTLNDSTVAKWIFISGNKQMNLEFNGGSISLTGGAIFAMDLNGDGNFMDAIYILTKGNAPAPAVPIPAAALLLGTGIAGLVAMRRKARA